MDDGLTSSDGGEKRPAVVAVDEQGLQLTPGEERRLIRRIDRRLVLTIGAMYCVSLMDRTNMSAANIAGMSSELHLQGYRYVRRQRLRARRRAL